MSIKDIKSSDTIKFAKVFSPSDYGVKKTEWIKKPTHIPEPRKQTLYGIEVVDMHGNPAPYFARPKLFKDSLN